mmetsp:Transcript_2880/g.6132  ORF Transcript_2880/g.6132 Transcript_2880/m.6132 type:complete len:263 (-) Transcript_2880:67-855(-)
MNEIPVNDRTIFPTMNLQTMNLEQLIENTIMPSPGNPNSTQAKSTPWSTPKSTPRKSQQEDEYNVFCPNAKNAELEDSKDITSIGTMTTRTGEVAYLRGEPSASLAEIYNLFRNDGDIFVAIDGTSTAGKTLLEVKSMIAKSVSTKEFSHFRMRDIKHASAMIGADPTNTDGATTQKDGQLPGESDKKQVQREIDSIANHLSEKELEIQRIQKEVLQLKNDLYNKQKELESLHEQDEKWLEKKLNEMKARKSRNLWQAMSFA